MLGLCIFAVTKKLIVRVNKLEKVSFQTGHIVRILDGHMVATVSHNIVESFKNAELPDLLALHTLLCLLCDCEVRLVTFGKGRAFFRSML
jgi:hypothetical protein